MFFDDPKNALSVARTHQRTLLEQEQRERLAQQARSAQADASGPGLTSPWQRMRSVVQWLKARLTKSAEAPIRELNHLLD